jgi:hypothetical protein
MASLYVPKWKQFHDDAGDPLNGGKLNFTVTTTTTAKDTFPTEADAIAGTNANVNPVVLDADGRSPVEVWITGRYRLRTYTTADVLIADDDPIEDVVSSSDFQESTPTYGGNNSGTATALVFAMSPAITSYTAGGVYRGRITADFAGATTINWGGGVKSLVKHDGEAIASGDAQGPGIIEWVYDATTDVARLTSSDACALLQSATAGRAALLTGTHTIPVLASSMISRTTNGAAAGLTELATNDVMLVSKDFDQTTSEGVQFYVPMPKSWNEGTVTAQFGWTAASGAGTVTWSISATAFSNDDAMDTAFGSAQAVTDTLITANDMHITDATSAITIGGTPAESDFVVFQITRDIADTLNADAKLIWCKVFATLIGGNDA